MILDVLGGFFAVASVALLFRPRRARSDRDGRSPAQLQRLREWEGQ